MAYTNVQFIGYVIDTAPQVNPDGSQTYLGLSDPSLDISARCDLMQRAMQTAYSALQPQSPPAPQSPPSDLGDTLTVFMAPEFFFRGAQGAYQMDDVQLAVTTLQAMAASDQWQDWVFVFGSIVGVSSPTFNTPPYDIDPLATKEVYNFAPVQQGGIAAQGDTGARIVMKELMSGVDFIAAAANPGGLLLGDVEHMPASASGMGREQQQVNYDGAGVFSLAGITWGLEVCLDHSDAVRRLQKSPQLPGDNLIQLQVVPSCGMSIQAQSVITQDGGYVFNCDGSGVASHSTLAQQIPPLINIVMASSTPVSDAAIGAQSVSVSALYASGPGVVNIYPAQPIPLPQSVDGHTTTLTWPASPDYTFIFQLIYNTSGNFVTVLCEIRSKRVNFYGNNYFLPLLLQTQDAAKQDVRIQMSLAAGSSPYAGAVWCKISVPGFIFEGNAFEFSATFGGLPPFTVW